MDEFWHIWNRFWIHFTSATGLMSWIFYGLRLAIRKKPKAGTILPTRTATQLLVCGLILIIVAFAREPADVASGGWVVKSYIDLVSWIAGGLLAYFVIFDHIKIHFER